MNRSLRPWVMTAKVLEVTGHWSLTAKVIMYPWPSDQNEEDIHLNFSDKGPNKHREYLRYHITGRCRRNRNLRKSLNKGQSCDRKVCQISCIYSSTAWWSKNKLNIWKRQGSTSQRYVQGTKKAQETCKYYQRTVTLSLYTVCTSLKIALAVMDHSL